MIDLFATLLGGITLLNRIITTGILITAFALVIYIGLYNRRSHIARAYAGMLLCIMGIFLGDLLAQISSPPSYDWLRFQWIGIALMPAAALGQSDALLRATGEVSPIRRNAVRASYLTGVIIFLLAAFTNLVAAPGDLSARLPHLIAFYLKDLAGEFHGWYNAERMLVEDAALRDARVALAAAVRQTIRNGMTILGVSCPDSM